MGVKVKVAWPAPGGLQIPRACANCGARNVPLQNIQTEVLEVTRISHTWRRHYTYHINFPYCQDCAKKEPRFLKSFRNFGVDASMVQTKKYGKLLRRKDLRFIELTFANDTYAQLFIEANKHALLDNVLAKLKEESTN
jgi:hypothetical protein